MNNKEWRKYDVPFIGSDELPPTDEEDLDFSIDYQSLINTSNSLVNISLTKEEWMHIYNHLSWEFQINGYNDNKLDKILNEFRKQLLIVE